MEMHPIEDVESTKSTKSTKSTVATDLTAGIEATRAEPFAAESQYTTGWKLHAITLSLLVCMFIVQMESSITSTSALDITDDLGGYEKSSWLFTAYFLTYCGLQMVWAKVSDITGRKPAIMASLAIFVVASGLCGASQTLTQLIHFRWVQGVGGCGLFALVTLIFFELVPPHKWPSYMSLVMGVIALSVTMGPLIGGAITINGSWRWIFLINVPIGVAAGIGLFVALPPRLWNEPAAGISNGGDRGAGYWSSLRRVDILGSLLMLGSCLFVSTGLQQAAVGYSWTSAVVLPLLVLAAPFTIGFFVWQWYVTTRRTFPEPVFPWRFCQSRIRIGMLLNTYLVGTVIYVCVVQIPQRFMTVQGLSSFSAATKLLVFGVMIPVGTSFAAVLMGKPRVPPCWVILAGAILQTIGVVLLSRIPFSFRIQAAQYGYQILAGTGTGLVNGGLTLLVPYTMDKRDLATGSSAISQFRVLGGLIGISIAASVSTPYIREHLLELVPPETVLRLLEKTETLSSLRGPLLKQVRKVFADGYDLQMKLLIGFAAAQVPATLLMWTNQVAEPELKTEGTDL